MLTGGAHNDRGAGRIAPPPGTRIGARLDADAKQSNPGGISATSTVGCWSTGLGHLIQDVARQTSLGPLPAGGPSSKTSPNDRLVPEEGVLNPGLPMVARRLLPPAPSHFLHLPDRAIASA